MADFGVSLNNMQSIGGAADVVKPNGLSQGSVGGAKVDGAEFRSEFQTALQNVNRGNIGSELFGRTNAGQIGALKFSNHAIERMQSRGIRFSAEQMSRIESAVQKAAAKGSKDTLLLTEQSALIVSVKDKTVVTVMDKASMKDNVFTNIDSTVMI